MGVLADPFVVDLQVLAHADIAGALVGGVGDGDVGVDGAGGIGTDALVGASPAGIGVEDVLARSCVDVVVERISLQAAVCAASRSPGRRTRSLSERLATATGGCG